MMTKIAQSADAVKLSRGRRKAAVTARISALAVAVVVSGLTAERARAETEAPAAKAPAAKDSNAVAEIVVTAQRRSESLQKVPASITALSGAEIRSRNLQDTRDVLRVIPNVNVGDNRGVESDMRITIRGVGTVVNNIDEPVAVYMDDVYLASAGMFNMSVVDLERVEVLRGPQGTLYGRNSMAGAVNFITREPQNATEGSIDATYGNYNDIGVKLMANTPINDKLFIRGNFSYSKRDGFIKDITTGDKTGNVNNIGGRLQLKAIPSDDVTLNLEGDYSRDAVLPVLLSPASLAPKRETYLFDPFHEKRKNYGGSAKLKVERENFSILSITGLRYLKDNFVGSDFTPVNAATQGIAQDDRQFSEEVRLVSRGSGPLKWVLGAFYLHESRKIDEFYRFNQALSDLFGGGLTGYTLTNPSTSVDDAYAVFGDATYSLSDQLDLSAGIRFGDEKKKLNYAFSESRNIGFTPFGFVQQFDARTNYKSVLPKATLTYHVNHNALVYATVAKGGKSGGFDREFLNQPLDAAGKPLTAPPTPADLFFNYGYAPEYLWNYEVGFKSAFLDHRVILNGAAFYMDWRNQQITVSNGIVAHTGNIKKARSYGAELELVAKPIRNLDIDANVAYDNATFVRAPGVIEPVTRQVSDLSGNREPNNSKYTANLGVQYTVDLAHGLRMPLRADYAYRSKQYFEIFNLPALSQRGYGLLNLRVGVETDRWGLYAFANNVTDKHYLASGGEECTTTCAFFGADQILVVIGAPRFYGVNARLKF